jgi:hypothetical protein
MSNGIMSSLQYMMIRILAPQPHSLLRHRIQANALAASKANRASLEPRRLREGGLAIFGTLGQIASKRSNGQI